MTNKNELSTNFHSEPRNLIVQGEKQVETADVGTHTLVEDLSQELLSERGRQTPHFPDMEGGHKQLMSDSVRQNRIEKPSYFGHDLDLPARSSRHILSTHEVSKIFEQAECRVSVRTIIRWCNKNKQGVRRLDCAFDANDRKYYISKESVASLLNEEKQKGRQSDIFMTSLSDLDDVENTGVGDQPDCVGHRTTLNINSVGHQQKLTDISGHRFADDGFFPENTARSDEIEKLSKEITDLKIELTKKEEQGDTKDEMLTFLRQEIDRRVDQNIDDRETYDKAVSWYRQQLEAKDALIGRLNAEMRGLLESSIAKNTDLSVSSEQE
jgi:hypothetical protein